MSWSWRIGRVAGIDLRVHVTFPFLLLWVAMEAVRDGKDLAGVAAAVLLILLVLGIVVLHEFGHALTARRYGIATRDITLLPIGGVARLERMPREPRQELLVAVAGPAVNVVLAALLALVLVATGGVPPMPDLITFLEDAAPFAVRPLLVQLVAINLWLVAFNLLPAFPMDGGRVLRALLAMRTGDHARATQAAARVGRGFAIVFGVVGLFVLDSPSLVLIAAFVWLAGLSEATAVEREALLADVPLARLLVTDARVLAPDDPLDAAGALLLAGFQQDFPVLDAGRYVGMLSRADLVRGLAAHGGAASVRRVMRTDLPVLAFTESPDRALELLHAARATALPVLEAGRLLGLFTTENLMEYLMLRRAAR